jgi:hypothetical protein
MSVTIRRLKHLLACRSWRILRVEGKRSTSERSWWRLTSSTWVARKHAIVGPLCGLAFPLPRSRQKQVAGPGDGARPPFSHLWSPRRFNYPRMSLPVPAVIEQLLSAVSDIKLIRFCSREYSIVSPIYSSPSRLTAFFSGCGCGHCVGPWSLCFKPDGVGGRANIIQLQPSIRRCNTSGQRGGLSEKYYF